MIAEPHEFVLTFLGAVMAGIVPVPMYPRASFKAKNSYLETVAHIVRAAGARALFTLESTKAVVDEVLRSRHRAREDPDRRAHVRIRSAAPDAA